MSKKDARQLVKALTETFTAAESGYTVEKRGGHYHVVNTDGQSVYSFASTPSDSRFRKNTVSALRRNGIVPDDFR